MFIQTFRHLMLLLCWLTTNTVIADNRLAHATSPYLLRHAHHPINWYPWGSEALELAKKEQKLIFLSIGYTTCHWCRVMERESFTDSATAELLNAHYISIQVDREERPDLDIHFTAILTTMTDSSGWPLNMILTPELQPLYGGSYFPLKPTQGKPSFKAVLTTMHGEWQRDRENLRQKSAKLGHLLAIKPPPPQTPTLAESSVSDRIEPILLTVDRSLRSLGIQGSSGESIGSIFTKTLESEDPRVFAVHFWRPHFDNQYGGIGQDKKFLQPTILSLFLRQAANNNQVDQAGPALLTLEQMAAGGIRDQLGGAFHHYSTDRRWYVPHFAIMLYDNALLARVYLEAYQLTGQEEYALVVQEILDDLLTRFRQPGGCFISALDAESDHADSHFYTWTGEEITGVLGQKQAAPFLELFFDPIDGMVAERSVLRLLGGIKTLAHSRIEVATSRKTLLAIREKRSSPVRDDKLLTSWNGLAIAAMARAGAVLQMEKYITAAQTCLEDLNRYSGAQPAVQLRHSRRGDKSGAEVFLDDYAFLLQAILDLYEATFDLHLLRQARTLANVMLDRFQVAPGQPLQLTPLGQPTAIPAHTVLDDGLTPAGNSVALVALHRLALLGQDSRFKQESKRIRQSLASYLPWQATTAPELLHAWDYQADTATEVIVIGSPSHPNTQDFLREIRHRLIPGLILALLGPEQKVDLQAWPIFSGRIAIHDQPTAYVCNNQTCRLPVNSVADLAHQLDAAVNNTP